MKRVALGALALAMAVAQAPSAMATSITGSSIIDGRDTFSLTGITFTNGLVFFADGTLTPMQGLPISLNDFSFASAVGTTLFTLAAGTNDFEFTIGTLNILTNKPGTNGFLNITGTGTLTDPGFDPTMYAFTLTSSTVFDHITGYNLNLTPTSAITPEPASLLLLGSGLLGLAAILFRRARKPNSTLPC